MGLIDFKTNLKSLGYGRDKQGGGSSGLPYITNPIPEGNLSNILKYGTGGFDFLIRGGSLFPKIVSEEAIRLGKFFTSTNGILFTSKQNLLSKLGVSTEASIGQSYIGGLNEGIYSPLNSLAQITTTVGLHLNKNGIDPTGLSNLGLKRYFDVVKNNANNSRLIKLYNNHIKIQSNNPILYEYEGGPGSILGVGKTRIKKGEKEGTGINSILYNLNKNYVIYGGKKSSFTNTNDIQFNGNKLLGASDDAFVRDFVDEPIDNGFNFPEGNQLKFYGPQDDNSTLSTNTKGIDIITYQANQKSIRSKENKGNYGSTNSKYLHSWGTEDFGDLDIINFYFTIIDNDDITTSKTLYFPCFIEGNISDNFSANWRSERMLGRGEEFFTYEGFTRDIPLNFKVYARDEQYLTKMYDNLNILVGSIMPNYSSGGFMRGNLIKLTIGKYIESLPGIITSINLSTPQEASWDIRKGIQLSQLIDVNLNYKPIHNYLPSNKEKFFAKNITFE